MAQSTLRIGLLYPEVLGTYGDGGNTLVLAQRARWRGIDAEIVRIGLDEPIPLELDIYHLGGGEDAAQTHAGEQLRRNPQFLQLVGSGRPLLAICAGLQVLGQWYVDAEHNKVEGVGLLDCYTMPQGVRTIGEIVSEPLLTGLTGRLTGFENHGGATRLGSQAQPFARVAYGHGNGVADGELNDTASAEAALASAQLYDGVVQNGIVATYMHGPVLARNPEFADWLLARALGVEPEALDPLGAEPDIDALRAQRFRAVGL
ncbi:MAG: glutamine amidotransferase [Actinomycetaceae bacterium]|nr:glutamine amidotransferase [Arcanobacterium sp.]MDD7505478.1 glutamine amidotransferase [Actinomycetaceae bacterium]MDY6143164.1 glutamine amidotransferase [Arcanobacterium sp.]